MPSKTVKFVLGELNQQTGEKELNKIKIRNNKTDLNNTNTSSSKWQLTNIFVQIYSGNAAAELQKH